MTTTGVLLNDRVDLRPRGCDLYVWRGDKISLPFQFLSNVHRVNDAITNGSIDVFSEQAVSDPTIGGFQSGDVGKVIVGDNIPMLTTIASRAAADHITLSQAASGARIGGRLKWGTPFDVSNWTFTMQVRVSANSPTPLASFAFDTTHATAGLVIASLGTAATSQLPSQPQFLAWDLQRIDGSDPGQPLTLAAGKMYVGRDATR